MVSRIVSVNVGGVADLEWRGRVYRSAIRKAPVVGPVRVRELGLEGDDQADRQVHGGPAKAVYAYPGEHYSFWGAELGLPSELGPGAFGENLTVAGLSEASLHIGDELEAGSARFRVSMPRKPCAKLAARFGREDLPRRFVEAGRCGFYMEVLREGVVESGDEIRLVRRHPEEWSVLRAFQLGTGRAVLRDAEPAELPEVADLLRAAALPIDGFPEDTPVVLIVDLDGAVVGAVALEMHGPAALLRSAVVRAGARGHGLGLKLIDAVLRRAWAEGAASVSLLTETADAFFPRFGFRAVQRTDLPSELERSAELRGACPDTAVAMRLDRCFGSDRAL